MTKHTAESRYLCVRIYTHNLVSQQRSSIGWRLFEVPICRRSAIHLTGSVVCFLTRAATASLPGSFFRRQANSVSFQPKRDISSLMMRLAVSRWSSPE